MYFNDIARIDAYDVVTALYLSNISIPNSKSEMQKPLNPTAALEDCVSVCS